MQTRIFHPGNAGLLFSNNDTTILVDGIYDGSRVGMSQMPIQWQMMLNDKQDFSVRPDALVFTHTHEDHFCKNAINKYLNMHPKTQIYGGENIADTVCVYLLEDGTKCLKIGKTEIYTRKTEHDGEWYKNDYHESMLLKMGDESFFIAGDAKLASDDLKSFAAYADHVQFAFLNLYQLGDDMQLESVKMLKPDCIALYHLPQKKDDEWNYLSMARQNVKRARKKGIHIEVMEHMKWFERSV